MRTSRTSHHHSTFWIFLFVYTLTFINVNSALAEPATTDDSRIDELFNVCGLPYKSWTNACRRKLDSYFLERPANTSFQIESQEINWREVLRHPKKSNRRTIETLDNTECVGQAQSASAKDLRKCHLHDLVRIESLKLLCSDIVQDNRKLGIDAQGNAIKKDSLWLKDEARSGRKFDSIYDWFFYNDQLNDRPEEFRRGRKRSFLYEGWRHTQCSNFQDVVTMKLPNILIDESKAWINSWPHGINFGIHPVTFTEEKIAEVFEERGSMYRKFQAWVIHQQGSEIMKIAVSLH